MLEEDRARVAEDVEDVPPRVLELRVIDGMVWGIAERTTAERTARLGPDFGGRRALLGVRISAAIIGTLCGTLTLLTVVARMIGTWKS